MAIRTVASRAAVVTLAVLAAIQVSWVNRATNDALEVPAALLAIATLIIAVSLGWRNDFESRFAAVLMATGQLLLSILAVTVGLPGQSPQPDDPVALLTLATSVTVLALLWWDRQLRLSSVR